MADDDEQSAGPTATHRDDLPIGDGLHKRSGGRGEIDARMKGAGLWQARKDAWSERGGNAGRRDGR